VKNEEVIMDNEEWWNITKMDRTLSGRSETIIGRAETIAGSSRTTVGRGDAIAKAMPPPGLPAAGRSSINGAV